MEIYHFANVEDLQTNSMKITELLKIHHIAFSEPKTEPILRGTEQYFPTNND